jgi:hypothetical protein
MRREVEIKVDYGPYDLTQNPRMHLAILLSPIQDEYVQVLGTFPSLIPQYVTPPHVMLWLVLQAIH